MEGFLSSHLFQKNQIYISYLQIFTKIFDDRISTLPWQLNSIYTFLWDGKDFQRQKNEEKFFLSKHLKLEFEYNEIFDTGNVVRKEAFIHPAPHRSKHWNKNTVEVS